MTKIINNNDLFFVFSRMWVEKSWISHFFLKKIHKKFYLVIKIHYEAINQIFLFLHLILGSSHQETRWWRACSWSITRLHPVGWLWKWHAYGFPIQEKTGHMRFKSWHSNNGKYHVFDKNKNDEIHTQRQNKYCPDKNWFKLHFPFILNKFMGMENDEQWTYTLVLLWKVIHLSSYMHKYQCKIFSQSEVYSCQWF